MREAITQPLKKKRRKEMTGMNWISTKDKLPDKGQNVICAAKMDGATWWFGCCQYNGFFPWVRFDNPEPVEFWMLLPEPPSI